MEVQQSQEIDGLELPIEGGWAADLGAQGEVSCEKLWNFWRFGSWGFEGFTGK